jgi:hypothetical protein
VSTQKSVAHPVTISAVASRALVHDRIPGLAIERREESPAVGAGLEGVAGRPVVLDEDDQAARPAHRPRERVDPIDDALGIMPGGRLDEQARLHVDHEEGDHRPAPPGRSARPRGPARWAQLAACRSAPVRSTMPSRSGAPRGVPGEHLEGRESGAAQRDEDDGETGE